MCQGGANVRGVSLHNVTTAIPSNRFAKMRSMRLLWLRRVRLADRHVELPASVWWLQLETCELQELPRSLTGLRSLTILNLSNNPTMLAVNGGVLEVPEMPLE